MRNLENIRNVGILAHIDHGKTTLSDNLLMYCGLLSPSVTGEARALDFLEEEQRRGITIKSANISLFSEVENQSYVVNLIDTPGHVDFSSARDQSLRVIDGAIIVVDAVEGCLVQTEIVTRQALEEYVKPILFINKVDRLITELKYSLNEIKNRLDTIMQEFNNLIEIYAPNQFKNQWSIDMKKDNITFGSALHLWGGSPLQMLQSDMKFNHIIKFYERDYRQIRHQFPLSNNLMAIIIKQLPNPFEAQQYRIKNLWKGKISSQIGQNLINCDANGTLVIYLYRNISDENLGIVSLGRIFSGTLTVGTEIYSLHREQTDKFQQLFLFMGAHRESIKSLTAGNIVAFSIKNPLVGDTLVEMHYKDIVAFEKIKYETEAVVQYSIEPFHPNELKKMMELLKKIAINDPNLIVTVNEETGENLISGLGELHLDVIKNELKKQGLEVIISDPMVTYRESIEEKSSIITIGREDNTIAISIQLEPVQQDVLELLTTKQVNNKMDFTQIQKVFKDNLKWNDNIIQELIYFDNMGNLIFIREKEHQVVEVDKNGLSKFQPFEKLFKYGPLVNEPIRGVKLTILKLDSGSSRLNIVNHIALLKNGLKEAFHSNNSILLQPIYKIQIKTVPEYIGVINNVLSQRNGRILQIEQKGLDIIIIGEIPVVSTFGLATILRSKTSGHIFWQTFFSHWEKIQPNTKMRDIINSLKTKRGLK